MNICVSLLYIYISYINWYQNLRRDLKMLKKTWIAETWYHTLTSQISAPMKYLLLNFFILMWTLHLINKVTSSLHSRWAVFFLVYKIMTPCNRSVMQSCIYISTINGLHLPCSAHTLCSETGEEKKQKWKSCKCSTDFISSTHLLLIVDDKHGIKKINLFFFFCSKGGGGNGYILSFL